MKDEPVEAVRDPDQIRTYFLMEKKTLLLVTVTGIFYNIGMAVGPWFEGQLVQYLYDIINGQRPAADMIRMASLYVLTTLLIQVARAYKRFGVRRFANNTTRRMRRVLYRSLIYTDDAKLHQEDLGSLMTKAISDVDACAEGMRKFTTEIFDTGVVMIAYAVMLIHYDLRLALLSCMFTPIAYMIASALKKAVTRANARYKKEAGKLNQLTMDRTGNAMTYRIFGNEALQDSLYEEALGTYEKSAVQANLLESSTQPLYNIIAMLGVIPILWFGSRNVLGTGWTSWNIAAFTTFISCFAKLALKASKSAKLFNAVQRAEVSWTRIKPFMHRTDVPPVIPAPKEPVDLAVEDMACGWHDPLLSHISFRAEPGMIIGITGPVACGKSTLGKVLVKLLPYEGSIRVGGSQLRDMPNERLHGLISYMGHEPELLNDTVENNIRLGDAGNITTVLKICDLDREVQAMAHQEKTPIGEQGGELSGGQQARLALARTLFHARPIMILDDPFAAVDKATEERILARIRETMPGRVILLISHRLYRFPELDGVLFLADGKGSFGTHEELMKKEPGYARLYDKQMKGDDLDESEPA